MILNVKSQTDLSGFYVVYNRTSANEKEGIYGISHLVEHLICRNFDDSIVEEIQNNGMLWNAYTSPTNLVFYLTGLDRHVNKLKLKFLEKLYYIDVKNEEFENEKKSLLEEYTGIFSIQGTSHLLNLYRKLLNTYNSIGNKEDLVKIDLNICKDYQSTYYKYPSKIINVSKNIFIKDDIIFNDYKADNELNYIKNATNNNIEKNKIKYNKTSVIYLSPIIKENWANVFFINYLLSNGIGSPLYSEIRKNNGLAYFIKCSIDRLSDVSGVNIISTETDDNKVDKLIEKLSIILRKKEFLNKQRFDIVKNSIINRIDTVEINRYNNVETYIKPDTWSIEKQINNINFDNIVETYEKYYNIDDFYISVDKKEFL